MQAKQTYSDVYEQLLLAKDLQPLPKFKSSRSGLLLYPDAQKIPEFFKNNLLRSGRVIKVVKGKSALLRAFIYQLMKLTFEIEADNRVNYVEVLKGIIFHPTFLQEDGEMLSPISGRGCNDRQYKRIIADFIELMESQSIPNFELTLMEYPIVDQALTRTFQTYMVRCYHHESTTLVMLEWLCETFAVTLQCYGKCYHFKQPDIFLYEEEPTQFYLAFVNQMAEVSDYSESTYRFDDIRNINDKGRKARDWESSIPDSLNQEEELQYRNVEERFRNSAEPLGRRMAKEAQGFQAFTRKTFGNSETIRELVKQVDESIHEKPSDPSKSKIGSLLQIMSDRSKQDLVVQHRSPEISSSRQFSQEQRRYLEPLTTRTAQLDFKSELQEIMEEKHLSNVEQEQMTPQFTTNAVLTEEYYNPFTKKYSDLYMPHIYSNQIHFNQLSQKQDFKFYQAYQNKEPYQPQFTNNSTPPYNYNQHKSYHDNYSNYNINVNTQYKQPEEKQFGNYYHNKQPLESNLTTFHAIQETFPKNNIEVEEEDLFYRPRGKSKIVIQGEEEEHRGIQDTRGTIYRQFTDTRVLAVMASFEKMKTNMIRQRFRGVHQRDLFGQKQY